MASDVLPFGKTLLVGWLFGCSSLMKKDTVVEINQLLYMETSNPKIMHIGLTMQVLRKGVLAMRIRIFWYLWLENPNSNPASVFSPLNLPEIRRFYGSTEI